MGASRGDLLVMLIVKGALQQSRRETVACCGLGERPRVAVLGWELTAYPSIGGRSGRNGCSWRRPAPESRVKTCPGSRQCVGLCNGNECLGAEDGCA